MIDEATEAALRELLDRDQIVSLLNDYFADVDAGTELDGDRAHLGARLLAIHQHPGPNPPEPYLIANIVDADAVRTAAGWRLSRIEFEGVWTSGRSHFDIDRTEP